MKVPFSFEKVVPILLYVFIPTYYVFTMTMIRETLVEAWKMGFLKHTFHIILASWCFVNVIGNMALSIKTNCMSRMPSNSPNARYCDKCMTYRPPKSWHCLKCNVCIMRRDHHCVMFSTCIGINNMRYFFFYLLHVFISMVYSTYYIFEYFKFRYGLDTMIITFLRIMNPRVRVIMGRPLSLKESYVMFILLNIALVIWSGVFLMYHLRNILMGVTAYEAQPIDIYYIRQHWKRNIQKALGTRWYIAFLCPFVSSDLRGVDGEGM